jgi:hypothetical protein
MDNQSLTTQTQGAFDRIKDSLIHNSSDDLDEMIANLEYLLVKAKEIRNELKINETGGF